jgi:hypothetical protein
MFDKYSGTRLCVRGSHGRTQEGLGELSMAKGHLHCVLKGA